MKQNLLLLGSLLGLMGMILLVMGIYDTGETTGTDPIIALYEVSLGIIVMFVGWLCFGLSWLLDRQMPPTPSKQDDVLPFRSRP